MAKTWLDWNAVIGSGGADRYVRVMGVCVSSGRRGRRPQQLRVQYSSAQTAMSTPDSDNSDTQVDPNVAVKESAEAAATPQDLLLLIFIHGYVDL